MKKISRVHITPHMHWDREWYFSTEESRILLINNMPEILTRLEQDKEYKYYVLDGQTAILEDYFAIQPQAKERVKKLVEAGKLIIGPWYTQTDTTIVAGESIVRNMLYGMRDCLAFGEPMKIGYLPDSFGMSSQLPHIYNGFGIQRALFWRGCSERHGTDKTEFIWQSNDGSEVATQVLPLGYAIGKYLPDDKQALRNRLDSYFDVLEKASVTGDILLPNGHDQMPIQQNIFSVMETLRQTYPQREFVMSRFEQVYECIEANREKLATLKGEFNDGKYMRVHRTISSTRMDIKLAHAAIENKIVNILEPLAAIAWHLGFDYHHGLLEKMWKEILKNHAHDSIGCCCSDNVHREIMARFILADDMAESLIQFYMRKIADNMVSSQQGDKLCLFNLLPYARDEIIYTTLRLRAASFNLLNEKGEPIAYSIISQHDIDPGLVDRQIVHYNNFDPFVEYNICFSQPLPAMGYCTLFIQPHQPGLLQPVQPQEGLENAYYRLSFHANGTLDIYDKRSGCHYSQALMLEEGSDDGDEYDYSPSAQDWLLYSDEQAAHIEIIHHPWESYAKVKLCMAVPANLAERQLKKRSGTLHVSYKITLIHHSPRIDIEMTLDNQADDHRVRVFIPTPFRAKELVTDTQFGSITRPVKDPAMAVWQQEGWKEAPIPVWNFLNWTALAENGAGLALFSEGLREIEVTGEQNNVFALTLFRSVGVLGKEALVLRPGRPSGIKLPTPDSQMRGQLHCRFSLFGFAGEINENEIAQQARRYLTPVRCYNKIPYDAMKMNAETFSVSENINLFSLSDSGLILSVLKKAEDEQAFIIRVYNPSECETIKGKLISLADIDMWQHVAMDELTPVHEKHPAGCFGDVLPCQSKTFKFTLKK